MCHLRPMTLLCIHKIGSLRLSPLLCLMSSSPEFIRLKSDDGVEVVVQREIIPYSNVLSMFLDETLEWEEAQTGVIQLGGFSGRMLERLAAYLYYRQRYEGQENFPDFSMEPEEALSMLLVGDYLDC